MGDLFDSWSDNGFMLWENASEMGNAIEMGLNLEALINAVEAIGLM